MNSAASAPASGTAGPTATDPVPSDPARTDSAPGDHDQAPTGGAEHDRSQPGDLPQQGDRPVPGDRGMPGDRGGPGGRTRLLPEDSGRGSRNSEHVWPGDPVPAGPAAAPGPSGPPSGALPPTDPALPLGSRTRPARRSVRRTALSRAAIDLQWLLGRLVDDVPGIRSVVVVSSDGLLLLSSEAAGRGGPATAPAEPTGTGPEGANGGLSTIVSGLGSLTVGAARLMDAGEVRQTVVAMDHGNLFVMSVSDGSLLGVHADPDCDVNVVAYEMGLFVGRAGHVLTPEVRGELRRAADPAATPE